MIRVIRYINCLRKKPGMSDAEFRKYWCNDRFNELVGQVAALSSAVRHAKNLALRVQATERLIQDRGIGEPYDGLIEYWWQDASQLMDKYQSPEVAALLQDMSAYQAQFIDLSRSTAFFTEDDG
jgi:hypothetical protein